MKLDLSALPNTVEALQMLVREQAVLLQSKAIEIERLTAQLARLKRMQFGRSSEKLDREIEQLELLLDDLHESEGARAGPREGVERPSALPEPPVKPIRRPLPDHLPREEIMHACASICPKCGGGLRRLGEDVTEVLEYVPASFKVVRHMRPKFSCRRCESITQPPMPSLPIERGRPGSGLLAHVLVSKYADHLPLYRQAEIYAREGIDLERSTLWPIGWAARQHCLRPWPMRCAGT